MFFQALHKTSLRESACTMRVCDVLLSLVTTLIDLGLLANCKGQTDENKGNQQQQGISTPPTSSNNIFSSPTKEIVDQVSNKRWEKNTAQEAKKVEKEVNMVRENFRDDKDGESGLAGMKDHVGVTTDQGGTNEKTEEKAVEDEDRLSHHNTFMDIVIR